MAVRGLARRNCALYTPTGVIALLSPLMSRLVRATVSVYGRKLSHCVAEAQLLSMTRPQEVP